MDTCAQALLHGDCHFMLCLTNQDVDLGFDQDNYASKIISKDYLVPVSSIKPDGTPRYRLPGNAKNPTPHLVYSKPSALGQMIDALLDRKGAQSSVKRHSESPAADNLMSLAYENHGVAWVANMRVKNARKSQPLMHAGDKSWFIPVDICIFKAKGKLPDRAESFWKKITEFAPSTPV